MLLLLTTIKCDYVMNRDSFSSIVANQRKYGVDILLRLTFE